MRKDKAKNARKVSLMRCMYQFEGMSIAKISRELGMTRSATSNILKNKSYFDITYAAYLKGVDPGIPKELEVAKAMLGRHRLMKYWDLSDTFYMVSKEFE